MKQIKYVSLILIFLHLATGCSGNYGNFSGNYGQFKRQSDSEAKATKRELIDNWSDYDIWLHYHSGYKPPRLTIIIFDTKNDDKEILVSSSYSKVKDQEMWTEIVKANTASAGDFKLSGDYSGGTSRVQGIWGPDNQLYGLIVYQGYSVSLGSVKQVDENAIRLSLHPAAASTNR